MIRLAGIFLVGFLVAACGSSGAGAARGGHPGGSLAWRDGRGGDDRTGVVLTGRTA